MFASKEIAQLKADLEAAQNELAQAQANNGAVIAERDSLTARLSAATTDLSAAQSALTAANEKITTIEAAHAAKLAELKANEQARIEAAVIERCAAAGVEPVKREAVKPQGDSNTLALDEWKKLSAHGRQEFFRKGGKLE